jgi:hypothetical protein
MSDNCIELSVRLTDGSFESKITLPLNATEQARTAFVQQWYELQKAALKVVESASAPRQT